MRLLDTVRISDFQYYVVLVDTKSYQRWYLFSEIHPSKYAEVGAKRYEDALTLDMLYSKSRPEYLVEALHRSKKTGKTAVYKDPRRLGDILKSYLDARDYAYPKSAVIIDESEWLPVPTRRLAVAHGNYSYEVETENGIMNSLKFRTPSLTMNFIQANNIKLPRKVEFEEKKQMEENLMELVSINAVSYETLEQLTNLDWYRDKETGEVKKNYVSIDTKRDFERYCMTPMVRSITRQLEQGIRPVLSSDTETSGFKLYYLSDLNPEKDKISTIQFAWEDDQGVIVYLDMEHFDNVDKDYVLSRTHQLFRYAYLDKEVRITLLVDEDGSDINEEHVFLRSDYDLTGHNTTFDSRVTLCEGHQFYFDHDTLQMAFNLNPITFKRNKGLKQLERYFFNETPPELSDLLGKGNEDKFRYLTDRRVTEIYGCADVDYSRKVFFKLKELNMMISPRMYNNYKQLDPMMWYLAAQSEYYGLRMDQQHIAVNSACIKKDLHILEELIYSYVGAVIETRTNLVKLGVASGDTSLESLQNIEIDLNNYKGNQYRFKLAGAEVRDVMYKLLKYPVLVRSKKTNQPAVNTDALDKLMYRKNKRPSGILKEDVLCTSQEGAKPGKPNVLISAEKFNSYKYPLCYLLRKYAELNKEYTTYYRPFEEEDLEGRLFKPIKTTNIETRRISCAAQQVKKSLKKAILPVDKDYYCADWDLNQVEARIFISESGDKEGIARLMDCERDYHTENASLMYGIPPHLVPKDLRSKAKAIGFGIPYGLSDFKLCERLFTTHSEEHDMDTRILKAKFCQAQHICMAFLEDIRAKAIQPVEIPVELKRFWGVEEDAQIGLVTNRNGFYRYFTLDKALGDPKAEASIQRAAGNFPIQSFAADLFRKLLIRFYNKLLEYGIEDKVKFNMYIHDELLFSVHKSIDPRLICKIAAEACMIKLKNHTNYFIGLGFGKSWYEAKIDPNETPTGLLLRMKRDDYTYEPQPWTDDPMALMRPLDDDYKKTRVIEMIEQYIPGFPNATVNIHDLVDRFSNYTVASYITEFPAKYKARKRTNYSTGKEEDDNVDVMLSHLCGILTDKGYGDVKLEMEGTTSTFAEYPSTRQELVASKAFEDDELEFEDDDDEEFVGKTGDDELDFFSFDSEEAFNSHVIYMYEDDDDEDELDILNVKPKKSEFKYVRRVGKIVKMQCSRSKNTRKIEEFLKPFKSSMGTTVIIETPLSNKRMVGKYDIPMDKVDEFLSTLN